ncbi:MAG: glucosyltransferase domain-containing protein [Clostridia bacterium]
MKKAEVQMIEKKKNNKNQMYTFFVMLMFAVIICSNFFRMHFSQDTYCINVDYGYDRYIKHFLSIGRILGAVQMFITKKLNIPFETMVIGSSVSATILLTLSWFMLYSYTIKIAKIGENKKKQLLIAGITFSIIFNFCTFETLVFAEAIVLAFSILCATLASCIYTSNLKRKNIYTAILIFLTILAYQTSTSLFLIITLVFIAFKNKGNIKEILKKSIYVGLIFGVSMILGLLITKFLGNYLNWVERETTLLSIKEMIQTIVKYLDFIVIKNFYIEPKGWNFIVIIFLTIIFIAQVIKSKEYFHILEYIVLVALCCIIPILPLMAIPIKDQYMETRMAMVFGALAGTLLLYLILVMKADETKVIKDIISIITITLFVINSIYFIRSSSENIATGYIDRNIAKSIIYNIEKYEKENDIKLKKIVVGYDKKPIYYYEGQIMLRSTNGRGLATNFTVAPLIEYYCGEKYDWYVSQEEIDERFLEKNWDAYSEEQLVFEGDTLYLCVY